MTTDYSEFGWSDAQPAFYHELLCKYIERLLPADGSPILDVGCGNGFTANYLAGKGYDVYGIDASRQGIAIANRTGGGNPGRFFVCDVTTGELPPELRKIPFRTVISMEVIEHLYSPRTFAAFVRSILEANGGGRFILTTPYHGYLKNLSIALAGKADRHYSALWEGGHIKFWSRRTLAILLREAGFRNMAFTGAGRIPYLWRHMVFSAEAPFRPAEPYGDRCRRNSAETVQRQHRVWCGSSTGYGTEAARRRQGGGTEVKTHGFSFRGFFSIFVKTNQATR